MDEFSITSWEKPMPGGRRFRILVQILVVLLVVGGLAALAIYVDSGPGPIVYRVAGMEQVGIRKNIVYQQDGKDALGCDVYLPAGVAPSAGWPCVVLIHGGPVSPGTNPKDWQAFESWGRVLGASGLAAVTFNHRFFSDDAMATATMDVAALLKYVREHSAELKIDPQKICLWAFSGGGPQLAFAIRENTPWVKCMVVFYARMDARGQRYSPLAQIRAGPKAMAPMLIARMGQDSTNINDSLDAFAAEASKRGLDVRVIKYPQGVHGFDISQDTDESRRIIAQAIGFVKGQLIGAMTMQAASRRGRLAIANVTVIDVALGKQRADQTVIVSNGKIAEVGPAKEIKISAGTRVIDGKGKFLIPGLWDMHVHLLWEPAIDTLFPLCIANGVTGVRDMHTHFPFEQIHRWQKEIEEGRRVGPRFVYAGPILDGPQPIGRDRLR
jgi:acetyl esterase/lipase